MMINSRDQEDHVELSINPEFPTYAGVPVHPIHKFDTIAELQSEPTSIDQAPQGKHSEPVPRPFWKEQSTVNGMFANVPLWDKIFVTSCVIAVCMDPLFFYIPVINEEQKCLGKDTNLRDVALLLRFLTDITFLLNIIYQIRERILLKTKPSTMEKPSAQTSNDEERGGNSDWDVTWKGEYTQFTEEIANIYSRSTKKIAQKLPWLTLPVFIDILSVIPIPQVLLVYAFFEMRGPGYLDYRKILSTFLLAQYLPRTFRIFLSSREFTKTTGIWVKGAFNFFLYILASHVLGAFWYFFSIQRETSCWHRACVKYANESLKGSCMDHFYCSDNQTTPNLTISFLDEHCPLKENATDTQFDFGIFLESLENGNAGHVNFVQKFFYSFWWGLRNLSNFGTSLDKTSTYVWENCFAILISIVGLLLFLYLIGNVQTLMQFETTKWEEIRRKMQMKELDLQVWMERNKIPADVKKKILQSIKRKLEEDKDANLENLYNVLPWDTRKN